MKTHEIRERFTKHFVDAGHTNVPSASLVLEDPNLLFVNAGMVPFKPYFLGQQNPPFESGTATSIQKCVRTLDIDEVGITTRHNTFFQMAGNFSFGQYFKRGAIKHAWSLLTDPLDKGGYGLDPDRLWVTVFEHDDEAEEIWRDEVGVPAERIQRLGMEDNYWSMGVPGPCGPCSEIYYDRGPEHGKEGGPAVDDTRYMEIWNLVFMGKERGQGIGKDDFEIVGDLPKKNIDTGMGVERVACILQGVDNVYETDLLRPVIDVAEDKTGATYEGEDTSEADNIRFRVIADHSRTAMMIILDGVTPGNEGRGYILRRLLRRIVRSARLLGATGPTMEAFIDTVMDTMAPSFPEIDENRERIRSVATREEQLFLKTLSSGTRLFEETAQAAKAAGSSKVSGERAFELHDTYGFPIDLTLEMAEEAGLEVDMAGFDSAMAEQKARAKADSQKKKHGHEDLSVYREFVDNQPTEFLGYDRLESGGNVIGLVRDGKLVGEAPAGTEVEVILDATPFYAESGGQLGDRGVIATSGASLDVRDVQKVGKKVWVHKAEVTSGGIAVGDAVDAKVDGQWRHGARQAHSATHLVHAAVRQVLGPTAVQAGSMNRPGFLRFDFNYGEQLTEDQLREITDIANQAVDTDWQVNTFETSLDEAKAMGALALFGENYGDQVRVVEIGGPFSMELCGGTHVEHSSQVGPVSVLGESSVGSGARRIEAYTGLDAFRFLSKEQALISGVSTALKTSSEDVPGRVAQLAERLREAEKLVERLRRERLLSQGGDIAQSAELVGATRLVARRVGDDTTGGDLRTLAADVLGRLDGPAVVALAARDTAKGKVPFIVAANEEAVSGGHKAGDLVKLVGSYIDGRGGGKPAMAQGSGAKIDGLEAGFAALRDELRG